MAAAAVTGGVAGARPGLVWELVLRDLRLPRTIGRLVNLQLLYLHENRLVSLPNEIGRLKGRD